MDREITIKDLREAIKDVNDNYKVVFTTIDGCRTKANYCEIDDILCQFVIGEEC